jgi:hypothetical protein
MTSTTTSTIDIADLISLLDKPTLAALSARLQKVAEAHETPADPGQLLFEFIEDSLTALEEEIESDPEKEAQLAEQLLSEIQHEASK